MAKDEKKDDKLVVKEAAEMALYSAMEEDAGRGNENVTADDKSRPYWIITQSKTPVAEIGNDKHVEGVQPGMFFNTVTEEFTKNLHVIPCAFQRKYVEKEMGERGQFIGFVDPFDMRARTAKLVKNEKGKKVLVTNDGTLLIDTRYHFVLGSVDGINFDPVVLKFKSSQIRKSQSWLTNMEKKSVPGKTGLIQLAPWWQLYMLATIPEKTDNYNYFGYNIEYIGAVKDAQLGKAGKKFCDMVLGGDVVVKEHDETSAKEEDIPF